MHAFEREKSKDAGRERNEDMGTKTRRMITVFPLRTDDCTEKIAPTIRARMTG